MKSDTPVHVRTALYSVRKYGNHVENTTFDEILYEKVARYS